jgi:hypothetical protein
MGSIVNCSLNASSADDPFPVIYAKMPYHVDANAHWVLFFE